MKHTMCILAALATVTAFAPTVAVADSISQVEGARAAERAGRGLTRQDVEKLNRYGGNDDGFYSGYGYGYGPGYGYTGGYGGPSVGVTIGAGPGYGYAGPGYYSPYGNY